jgi:hypothetical protein
MQDPAIIEISDLALSDSIKLELKKTQYFSEEIDPAAESSGRFSSSEAVLEYLMSRDANMLLSDVQRDNDRERLRAIETRAEKRKSAGQDVDPETDKKMALVDAHDFRRIQHPAFKEAAALIIAESTREYPDYKTSLDKDSSKTARAVAILDTREDEIQRPSPAG